MGEGKVVTWQMVEKGHKFLPSVTYTYQVGGKIFSNQTLLENQVSNSLDLSKREREKIENRKWIVFYNPNQPEVSALENNFPYKEIIYLGCLLGVSLWFIGLGFYVGRQERNNFR